VWAPPERKLDTVHKKVSKSLSSKEKKRDLTHVENECKKNSKGTEEKEQRMASKRFWSVCYAEKVLIAIVQKTVALYTSERMGGGRHRGAHQSNRRNDQTVFKSTQPAKRI